jgi:hypothetical protein
MRFPRSVLCVFALSDCRSTAHAPEAAVASANGPLVAVVETANAARHNAPAMLTLVAVGKELTLSAVPQAHSDHGPRIQITGQAFAAHADGDGVLVADAIPEPSFVAPFDPAQELVTYAGVPPNLFAFRRKNVPCNAPDDATLLVLQGNKWREHRLRGRDTIPHAFFEWEGSALFVDSPVQACGWATSSLVERLEQPRGTVFTQIAPTGARSHPTLGLDSTFMAWGASSAEQSLALVGTYGVREKVGAPAFGSHDIVVMRRHGKGPFSASVIVKADGPQTQSSRTYIREFGSAALLWPPPVRDDGTPMSGALAEGGDEIAWKGHASSLFRITDEGTTEFTFRSVSEQDCYVKDAAPVGQDVYAIVACPDASARLVRAVVHGEPERVELPTLPALPACSLVQVIGRVPDDLWVRAVCGSAEKPDRDAIFRRGHMQKPLVAP